jgi:hypothetical protein
MPSRVRRSNRSRIPLSPYQEEISQTSSRSQQSNSEGTFVLERDRLRDKLEVLRSQASCPIDKLDSKHEAIFKEVVGAMKNLYDTSLYHVVMKDIVEVFEPVSSNKMVPGTVHSFFLGCASAKSSQSGLKPGCDPKCASGFPDPNTTVCDDTFLSIKDDKLMAHNTKKTTHAYIFIEDKNFRGFTPEHIDDLRRSGISKASLIRVKENQTGAESKSQYLQYNTTEAVSLDSLPMRSPSPTQSNSSWYTWIIIGIIAILFLGAAAWYVLSSG